MSNSLIAFNHILKYASGNEDSSLKTFPNMHAWLPGVVYRKNKIANVAAMMHFRYTSDDSFAIDP